MGAALRRIGFVAAFLAWAAFLLPWERCESACHDRVLPQLGAHACHAGDEHCHDDDDCAGDGHEEEHDARHSAVDFSTLRPDSTPGLPAALPVAAAPESPPVAASAASAGVTGPAPVPPAVSTVVLLL